MSNLDLAVLPARVGEDLGSTGWQTITQADIQMFADATRAHEWIHVDAERCARESPFARTVAHGYLTLSLATAFVTELLGGEERGVLGVNYGLDRVRFPAPVPVGARVRARGTLRPAVPDGDGVRTVVELVYEVEGAERPPCAPEVVSLLVPAASGG
jgi:acyl dehydratase